jgi:hypothetical protein
MSKLHVLNNALWTSPNSLSVTKQIYMDFVNFDIGLAK